MHLCSDSLLDEVGAHLLNKTAAVLHVLGPSIAVNLILLPEADDDGSSGLTNNGTTTATGKLGDGCIIVLKGEHVLGLAHANTSLRWLSVAISGTHSAGDFVHFNVGDRAIHTFKRVLVSFEVTTLVARGSPEGSILAIDSSTVAHTGDGPIVDVVVESIDNLIGVSLPVSHSL